DTRGLLDVLMTDNSDESRTRVRAALRRAVESVTCLFKRAGRDRLAIVKVAFVGGGGRGHVSFHPHPVPNRTKRTPGRWWARSIGSTFSDGGKLSGFRMGGPIVDDPSPELDVAVRDRFRRYAAGEDDMWRCTQRACGCEWTPRQRPPHCPRCGGRTVVPVIPP